MHSPFYLCGPTASGKSTCALALAKALDGEIINGDAFQIYRGLETLTAAPSEDEKAQAPHYLYGKFPLTESFDAARYESLARPIIEEVQARGKLPIIVGGSGLYLKFLTHGCAQAPPGDDAIRAKLDQLAVDEIYHRLRTLDPEEAARQNSQNRRHLTRALEICLLTGQKASDLRKNFADPKQEADLKGIVITWPRDELAERIAKRTVHMLQHGAIEEVAQLPAEAATVRQAIGVKEIEAHLRGDLTREECLEKITIATRQYAKRQRNWFRRESWLTSVEPSNDWQNVISAFYS